MDICKSQKGFGVVGLILILVIIGVVGCAGWYVWRQASNDQHADTAVQTDPAAGQKNGTEPAPGDTPDPTADWKTYTSEEAKFSLRYPNEWMTAANIEYCGGDVLLLGTSEENAGLCQSDAPVLVVIARPSLNPEEWLDISRAGSGYTNVSKSDVVVDGVDGTKVEGTYNGSGDGPGPRPGAKVVHYYFVRDGHTYYATYTQNPADPDVLEEFNLIVTKTLTLD